MKRILVIAALALSSLAVAEDTAPPAKAHKSKSKTEKKTETKTETKSDTTEAPAAEKKAE